MKNKKTSVIPGPHPRFKLNQVSLEQSNISFNEMIQLYIDFFNQKGNSLNKDILFKSTPTQHIFETDIDVEIPKEQNSGHLLTLQMIVKVIINEKYIFSLCEMVMDEKYYNSNKDILFYHFEKLNKNLNQLGINHYIKHGHSLGPKMGMELVWKNLLTEESFNFYYSQLLRIFEQFVFTFDFLQKYLKKLDLGNKSYVFPVF